MIYLVRHGQTEWNILEKTQGHTNTFLNKIGKEQAQGAANRAKKLKIDKIISSDLDRAKETAEIINKNFNLEIKLDTRLRGLDYGILEGKTRKILTPEMWDEFESHPEKFNAESMEHVYNRIKSFFSELDTDENTLVVTHGGAIRVIAYYANNKEKFSYEEYKKNFRNLERKHGGIFIFDKNITPIS